jgi:hypothetical protein
MENMKTFLQKTWEILLSKKLGLSEILILAILLLWGFTKDIASVEFHPDESFWIVSSVRFDKLITGDFESPTWTEDPIIMFEVRPVPSYFSRIGQRIGGISADSLPVYWSWGLSDEENIALNAMPSDKTLWWSRLPMAIISALSMLLTAMFLAKSHSRLSGYIFALISFNAFFLMNLRRAMSEASILFFTVLAIYASYKLISAARNRDMNKSVQWSLILGLFSGLAGESKLTGLICAGIGILGVFLVTIPKPAQWPTILKQRLFLIIVFIVTMTTIATFIASYPLFYTHTVDKIWETFHARGQIMDFQIYTYPETLMPPNGRLATLFEKIFDYPLRTNANWEGLRWVNLLVVTIGMIYSIKQAWHNTPEKDANIILWLGTLLCAVPMLFTPFNWERYYLFPIYFSCIFFAIGISQLVFNFRTQENTK